MVDKELVLIAGSVTGAVAVTFTLMNNIYGVFADTLDPDGAMALSAMGVILLALLVLAIDTRIKLNRLRGDDE